MQNLLIEAVEMQKNFAWCTLALAVGSRQYSLGGRHVPLPPTRIDSVCGRLARRCDRARPSIQGHRVQNLLDLGPSSQLDGRVVDARKVVDSRR